MVIARAGELGQLREQLGERLGVIARQVAGAVIGEDDPPRPLGIGVDEGGPGQRARQANLDGMAQLMLRGQARGELTRAHRAEDLGSALGSLINGTITHWLYDDASEPLPERMRRAAEVFLDGAAAPAGEGTQA